LEPWSQRLGRWLDDWSGRRWVKRQRVYRVEIGDLRLKRIEMTDTARAAMKETALRSLAHTGILPCVIARHHADLWVEFLEGAPVRRDDPDLPQRFAELLAELYGAAPVRRELGSGFSPDDVRTDLDVLARARLISPGDAHAIGARLDAIVPSSLWVGFDHTDLLLKNMLRGPDGRLRLIDVESVVADEAIGTGFSKAADRWMGERRGEFVAAARLRVEIPDFYSYLPYLEIRYLASWTKRSLLLGKSKLARPEPLQSWLARNSADAR
jgi:hypothetical protein